MCRKTAASRRSAPGDSPVPCGRRGSEVAREDAGHLNDSSRGGCPENQRTVGGKGSIIVQGEDAVGNGSGPGIGVAAVAQVPLSGGGLGKACHETAAVSKLRVKSVVTGRRAGKRQGAVGVRAMHDRTRVTPDDGVVVGDRAGKRGTTAGECEEPVSSGGMGADGKGVIDNATTIDKAG